MSYGHDASCLLLLHYVMFYPVPRSSPTAKFHSLPSILPPLTHHPLTLLTPGAQPCHLRSCASTIRVFYLNCLSYRYAVPYHRRHKKHSPPRPRWVDGPRPMPETRVPVPGGLHAVYIFTQLPNTVSSVIDFTPALSMKFAVWSTVDSLLPYFCCSVVYPALPHQIKKLFPLHSPFHFN